MAKVSGDVKPADVKDALEEGEGLLELKLPGVPGGVVNIHLPERQQEKRVEARFWDFDRTIVDLEKGYRAWIWLAICQVLKRSPSTLKENLPESDITREEAWGEIFRLAFGLPTDKTNETVVELLAHKGDKPFNVIAAGNKEFSIESLSPEIQKEYRRLRNAYENFVIEHEDTDIDSADLVAQIRHESMIMFLAVTGEETGLLKPVDRTASAHGRSIWEAAAEAVGIMRLSGGAPMLWAQPGERPTETFKRMLAVNLEGLDYMSDLRFALLPGVPELLRDSRERNIAQGIASSSDRIIVETVLSCLKLHLGGYEELFDAVIGCRCVPPANRKPSGYPYLALFDEINRARSSSGLPPITPGGAVVFEDNATGTVAAGLSGLGNVVVVPSGNDGHSFAENTADCLNSLRTKLQKLKLDDVSATGREVLIGGFSRIAVISAGCEQGRMQATALKDFLEFFEDCGPFYVARFEYSTDGAEMNGIVDQIVKWKPDCIVVFPEGPHDVRSKIEQAGFDPRRILTHSQERLRTVDFTILPSHERYSP